MTPADFKLWIDGFAEGLAAAGAEAPTPEQWRRVLEQVARLQQPPAVPATGIVPAPAVIPPMPSALGPGWWCPRVTAGDPPGSVRSYSTGN